MRGRGLDGVRLGAALAHCGARRSGLAGMPDDRSSRPASSPRRCSPELEERLCAARLETGWGPRLIAGVTGVPHQTVWKVLQRAGCSRRPKPPRETANRYEWPCPGDLLHMDTKRYARFTRPGHAVTGERTASGAEKREQVGHEYAHAIIDDHTRLAYSELHPDELADTVVAFTQRALAWYARHGITPKRVMTDNAWNYTHSPRLKELLAANGITAPHDHAAQTTDERQDRALPSDHGPRMGLRPHLPLKHPPRPRPATLARPLQRAPPPQRHRQPATHQPRTERLEAGQLGEGGSGLRRARGPGRLPAPARGIVLVCPARALTPPALGSVSGAREVDVAAGDRLAEIERERFDHLAESLGLGRRLPSCDRAHTLELDEGAESFDIVEVDADVVVEKAGGAACLHNADDAVRGPSGARVTPRRIGCRVPPVAAGAQAGTRPVRR